MLNEQKVALMTKAASYENGKGKKDLEVMEYYQSDYVAKELLKSFAAYTVAFFLCVILWFIYSGETILEKATKISFLTGTLILLAVLYVAGLVLYEILVLVTARRRYHTAKKNIQKYQDDLKDILQIYTQETETARENTEGDDHEENIDF